MDDTPIKTPKSEAWAEATEVEQNGLEEEMDVDLAVNMARFLRSCWAMRRMVFSISVVGILISLLFALLWPATYTSTTTLMPPDSTSSSLSILGMQSGSSSARFESAALGLNTPGDLFIGVLASRTVQDSLVSRFNLTKYYKTRLVADARKSLAADTHIVQDTKSGIVSISVNARNPMLASQLAQAYVEELNRVMTDDSTSSARRERIFLEERVKEVKHNLDDAAKALSHFSTKNRTIDMPSQARSMVDTGLKLQAEIIDGQSQLAALRQNYSEDNWRVRAAEARNAELQRQMDKMSGLPQGNNSNAEGSKSVYPTAVELPTLGLAYYDLERRVQVEQTLWETLTKEYEVAKVQEAKEIPAVRVLDPANVPERKSGPHRLLISLAGTMLSCVLACLCAFGVSFWKDIDPQDEPKKLLIEVFDNMLHPTH